MAFPQSPAQLPSHRWRWFAAAACAALVVFAMLPKHRDVSRKHPDIMAIISSTQSVIARLSIEPLSTIPAWASPTASLLDEPRIFQ
jgi:hypothetical protein